MLALLSGEVTLDDCTLTLAPPLVVEEEEEEPAAWRLRAVGATARAAAIWDSIMDCTVVACEGEVVAVCTLKVSVTVAPAEEAAPPEGLPVARDRRKALGSMRLMGDSSSGGEKDTDVMGTPGSVKSSDV